METKRCLLYKMEQSDYKHIIDLYQNEKVRKYLGGTRTEEEICVALPSLLNRRNDAYYWIIKDKNVDEFIGLISLDTHHNGKDMEVSYQLLPK